MQYRILVAEDQFEIRDVVAKYLEKEGYECLQAVDGFEALQLFNSSTVHLVILDVMMPGIDGFEVLEELRRITEVPVILLTARQQEIDRLKGFDIGADDYVIKPFSAKELMRRVKRLLQRTYRETEEILYECGELSLHTGSRKLYKNRIEIQITAAEYNLLLVMFKNQGRVMTREQLIQLAYGFDYDGLDRSIDSFIKRLRQKLEQDPKNPKYLVTRYGAGYVFGGNS